MAVSHRIPIGGCLIERPLRYGSAICVSGSGARTPLMASNFAPFKDGRSLAVNVGAACAPDSGLRGVLRACVR